MAKKAHLPIGKTTRVALAGALSQGTPLTRPRLKVEVPVALIDPNEVVFVFEGPSMPDLNLAAGDLLIVEPRTRRATATGELVIATTVAGGSRYAYIGRWWTKRGTRMLMDADNRTILSDHETLSVLGAVTLIVRLSPA